MTTCFGLTIKTNSQLRPLFDGPNEGLISETALYIFVVRKEIARIVYIFIYE